MELITFGCPILAYLEALSGFGHTNRNCQAPVPTARCPPWKVQMCANGAGRQDLYVIMQPTAAVLHRHLSRISTLRTRLARMALDTGSIGRLLDALIQRRPKSYCLSALRSPLSSQLVCLSGTSIDLVAPNSVYLPNHR